MNLEQFTEIIINKLQEHFGDCVNVYSEDVLKYGGVSYKGLSIQDGEQKPKPIFNMNEYFARFKQGRFSTDECVSDILEILDQHQQMNKIEVVAENLTQWEKVKEDIYPVLISVKENEELLQSLVNSEMLDLAVIYVIRTPIGGNDTATVKINHSLFKHYRISKDELHECALKNLEKEEYGFFDMEDIAMCLFCESEIESYRPVSKLESNKIYLFRNKSALYGAAGILNKELVREKMGKSRNCYVIPSSIHELLFIPVSSELNKKEINEMIQEVNKTIDVQERLSDHCYYYHGATQEFRMCE